MRLLRTLLLLSLPLAGCDDGTAAAPVDYAPLLKTLTDNVVVPGSASFATSAAALSSALATMNGSIGSGSLAASQSAWRAARLAWRKLDAAYFGPVVSLGIADRIDASPADTADIDALVNGTQTIDASLIAGLGDTQKGFLGIEYLIFAQDSPTAALSQLTAANGGARRRALAAAMAVELASSAQQLATAWAPSGGNYAGQVETAGSGSMIYSQQRGALDDFTGGVAYALELVVGVRLAMPLGLKTTGTPDPSLDPTSASDSAIADMTGSLDGVTAMYDGAGFASMVAMMNATLNSQAMSQMAACSKAVTAIPPPFVSSVANDTAVVQAAYNACKTWKDDWNTDITSALGATLHPDNDGD